MYSAVFLPVSATGRGGITGAAGSGAPAASKAASETGAWDAGAPAVPGPEELEYVPDPDPDPETLEAARPRDRASLTSLGIAAARNAREVSGSVILTRSQT